MTDTNESNARTGSRRPIDRSLLTILVAFRVVGMVWLVVMAGFVVYRSSEDLRVGIIVSAVVAAVVWTPVTALVAYRQPSILGTTAWLVVDIAIATWTALAPSLANSEIYFSGGYPISAAFIVAYSHGYAATFAASAIIALASSRVFTDPSTRSVEIIALNLIAPMVIAWTFRVLRRNDQARMEAEEALSMERAERIRAQEREDLAGHLHDSVLQTLALVQQNSSNPREVSRLARLQERDLRTWLRGVSPFSEADTFSSALETVASEIEREQGATIELVTVGDAPLDDDLRSVVQASREAMLNAAKYAPDHPINAVAECDPSCVRVTVRDRGPGFDPAEVRADRHGVKDSIIGRIERRGGTVAIRGGAGGGTEVEMVVSRS